MWVSGQRDVKEPNKTVPMVQRALDWLGQNRSGTAREQVLAYNAERQQARFSQQPGKSTRQGGAPRNQSEDQHRRCQ